MKKIDTTAPNAPSLSQDGNTLTIAGETDAVDLKILNSGLDVTEQFTVTASEGTYTAVAKDGEFDGTESLSLTAVLRDVAGNTVEALFSNSVKATLPVERLEIDQGAEEYDSPLQLLVNPSDESFIAIWIGRDSETGRDFANAQRYDETGIKVGDVISLQSPSPNIGVKDFSATYLNDGTLIANWLSNTLQQHSLQAIENNGDVGNRTTTEVAANYQGQMNLFTHVTDSTWSGVYKSGDGFTRSKMFVQKFSGMGDRVGQPIELVMPNDGHFIMGQDIVFTLQGDHGHVAVWNAREGEDYGGGESVFFQRFDSAGGIVGDVQILFSDHAVGSHRAAPVGADGGFVVGAKNSSAAFVEKFDSSGERIGERIVIEAVKSLEIIQLDEQGAFAIIYGKTDGIYSQHFDSNAVATGSLIELKVPGGTQYANLWEPIPGLDGSYKVPMTVKVSDDQGIYLVSVGSNGQLGDVDRIESPLGNGNPSFPKFAANGENTELIMWSDSDKDESDYSAYISGSTSKVAAIDTTAPNAPTLTTVEDTDNNSFDAGFTVTEGADVVVKVDGTALTTVELTQKFDMASANNIDTYTAKAGAFTGSEIVAVDATLTDAAGNQSGAATTLELKRIDTTAPIAPSLELDTDTNIQGDGITTDTTVNVTGLEVDATWEFLLPFTTWNTGTGTSFELEDGTEFGGSPYISYGSGNIKVRQTDDAGNVSSINELPGNVTIDAVPPNQPVLHHSGNVITFTGETEGAIKILNGEEDVTGKFTVTESEGTYTAVAQDGEFNGTESLSLTVVVTDVAGNESVASAYPSTDSIDTTGSFDLTVSGRPMIVNISGSNEADVVTLLGNYAADAYTGTIGGLFNVGSDDYSNSATNDEGKYAPTGSIDLSSEQDKLVTYGDIDLTGLTLSDGMIVEANSSVKITVDQLNQIDSIAFVDSDGSSASSIIAIVDADTSTSFDPTILAEKIKVSEGKTLGVATIKDSSQLLDITAEIATSNPNAKIAKLVSNDANSMASDFEAAISELATRSQPTVNDFITGQTGKVILSGTADIQEGETLKLEIAGATYILNSDDIVDTKWMIDLSASAPSEGSLSPFNIASKYNVKASVESQTGLLLVDSGQSELAIAGSPSTISYNPDYSFVDPIDVPHGDGSLHTYYRMSDTPEESYMAKNIYLYGTGNGKNYLPYEDFGLPDKSSYEGLSKSDAPNSLSGRFDVGIHSFRIPKYGVSVGLDEVGEDKLVDSDVYTDTEYYMKHDDSGNRDLASIYDYLASSSALSPNDFGGVSPNIVYKSFDDGSNEASWVEFLDGSVFSVLSSSLTYYEYEPMFGLPATKGYDLVHKAGFGGTGALGSSQTSIVAEYLGLQTDAPTFDLWIVNYDLAPSTALDFSHLLDAKDDGEITYTILGDHANFFTIEGNSVKFSTDEGLPDVVAFDLVATDSDGNSSLQSVMFDIVSSMISQDGNQLEITGTKDATDTSRVKILNGESDITDKFTITGSDGSFTAIANVNAFDGSEALSLAAVLTDSNGNANISQTTATGTIDTTAPTISSTNNIWNYNIASWSTDEGMKSKPLVVHDNNDVSLSFGNSSFYLSKSFSDFFEFSSDGMSVDIKAGVTSSDFRKFTLHSELDIVATDSFGNSTIFESNVAIM